MPLQDEVLLMILVVGLYLYDSALLLYCNEAIFVPAGKGWKVLFGFREPRIRGRELLIPAPWLPHRPMFRLAWQFEGDSPQSETADWQARRKVPWPMIAPVWLVAVALFLMLPLGLFTTLGHGMLLAAVMVIYPGIVSTLLYMWFHRDRMNLTKRQVGKFAFEFLTCPPFAVNVIRTISLSQPIDEDLATAARRLQEPEHWAATRRQLTLRLDEEIEIEDEGSDRMARLRAHRLKLAE